jgi:hypothetical protein
LKIASKFSPSDFKEVYKMGNEVNKVNEIILMKFRKLFDKIIKKRIG